MEHVVSVKYCSEWCTLKKKKKKIKPFFSRRAFLPLNEYYN